MGGGGGGQPTQTTAYNTNIPEYAKPYVMNMLGAGQNQLFTTTPGKDGEPGEITGFRPYQAYSSNPADYFAGPSSLQTSAYNAASQLKSPSQYQVGTSLAGAAGLGQLGTAGQAGMYGAQGAGLGQLGAMAAMPAFGAGQQYASQVTNPNAVQSYMSPYQQSVTDVAKTAALREAQMANQAANLASARSGTYGGARQALAQAERERGLLANLSNIQAQGSQSAYDRAIQNMQYGSNLGLQGITTGLQGISAGQQGVSQGLQGIGAQQAAYSGAGQTASTLGQLGTAQQQADVSNIGLQNQLGQQQQQYQQGIINQAVQDYATAQQYPYMQLSMMSNLLRGLPMQNMTTQQYQAQAPVAQQAAGLLGAYGAYKGAFKEGGAVVPGYKSGVLARVDNTLDDLADAGGIGALKKRLAETSSPKLRDEIQDKISELSGIAIANVGKLGTNLAGGGIIAFEDGGEVQHFYDRGKVEDPDNPYGYSGFGEVAPYDPRTAIGAQFAPFERLGNAIYGFGFKTKHQIQQEVKERAAKAEKDAAEKEDKKDDKKDAGAPPAAAPAAALTGGNNPPTGIAGAMPNLTGYKQAFYDATGIGPGPGVKNQALMSYLEGDQSRLGERYGEAGRMNKALAILEGAQDPRGLLAGATTSGKAFLKGEAELQKQRRAEEGQIIKMQADVEAAREAKARGDFDAYSKHMESAAERQNKLEVARIGAAAHGAAGQYKEQQIKNIQAAYKERTGKDLPYDAALSRLTELQTTSDEAKQQDMVKSSFIEAQKSISPGGANYKEYKKLLEKDPEKAKQYVTDLATRHYQGMQSAMAAITGGGNPSGGKPSVSNW